MKRILAILSGKGGAGKSTCALETAAELSSLGKNVLLIDLDAGLRCLDVMTGVDSRLVFDLFDVLSGRPLEDALLPVDGCERLSLLAAPAERRTIDGRTLRDFVCSVRGFDYILLDLPAGTAFPFCAALKDAADFIIVSSADEVSVRDAERVSDWLSREGCSCRLIINRFERRLIRRGYDLGIDDVIDRCGCRLLGVVPFDRMLARRVTGDFRRSRRKTKAAFHRIAKRISGYDLPLPGVKQIEKGK